MIKKIRSNQLRVGMHVHEFCGSWMDHPFWRARFTVRHEADLRRIVGGGVTELWIDTDKGPDVEGDEPVVDKAAVDQEVESVLQAMATQAAPLMAMDEPPDPVSRASALMRRSVPKITSLFKEARLGKAVDARGCEALVEEISNSVQADPGALISVARLKTHDEYTYMHSVAVCALMVALGRHLGIKGDLLKRAGLAGMLHDLGKACIPLEILNKPGKLTDAEFAVVKGHPELGHTLLLQGRGAGPVALDVCLHHHEKFDGTGYPHGLAGDKISLLSRMATVCDVYDAITSVRPYNSGWDPGEALRRMAQWKGHFDPKVFQAFVKTVGIYPVGSLVKLHSGRLAVVVAQNQEALLTPRVKVFYSTRSTSHIEPQEVNLASALSQDRILGCESPEDWNFKHLDRLWNPAAP